MLQAAWAGASWVALEAPAYRLDSLSPVMAGPQAPSDADLVRAIWAARGLGLKVALKLELEVGPPAPEAEGSSPVPAAHPGLMPAFRDPRDFAVFYATWRKPTGWRWSGWGPGW